MHRITVTALLDADEADNDEGLLCEVVEGDEKFILPLSEVEGASGPNRRLLEDYSFWFVNWPAGGHATRGFPVESRLHRNPTAPVSLHSALVSTLLIGGFYGAVLGAALASLDGALVAVRVEVSCLVCSLVCWERGSAESSEG